MSDLEELRVKYAVTTFCRSCRGLLMPQSDGGARCCDCRQTAPYPHDPDVLALIDEVEALRAEVTARKERSRRAAQMLIAEIGAPGPEYVDETAERAAVALREVEALRAKVARYELEAIGRSPHAGARDAKVELEAWRRDVTDGHPVLPGAGDALIPQPASPAFEFDPVGVAERVTGIVEGLGWKHFVFQIDSYVIADVYASDEERRFRHGEHGWYVYPTFEHGPEVGEAGKHAASIALLRAIADGRVILPEGAPGMEALTAEERAALGVEG